MTIITVMVESIHRMMVNEILGKLIVIFFFFFFFKQGKSFYKKKSADHNYFHNEYRHSHRDQQDTEPYQTCFI